MKVEIVTDATEGRYDDGGDHPEFRHTTAHSLEILLVGAEAEKFLAALPVYETVLEGGGA